jgi:hypothetical protein
VTRYRAILRLGRALPDRDRIQDPAMIRCLLRVMA